jgi:hypothetical protein
MNNNQTKPLLFCAKINAPHFKGLWLAAFAFVFVAQVQASPTAFGAFPNNSTHSSAAVAQAIANVPTNVGTIYDASGQTNDIQIWNFNTLLYTGSYNIATTLTRIRDGYWITTETDDGGFFNFNTGELPNIPRLGNNYYMEFVVWPSMNFSNATYDPKVLPFSGMTFPGAMRLLIGLGGQVYFTGDHYGEDGTQTNAYYVYPTPLAPQLSLTLTATHTLFAFWPATVAGFSLQENTDLTTTNWVTVTNTSVFTNGQNQITLPIPATGGMFYRLLSP